MTVVQKKPAALLAYVFKIYSRRFGRPVLDSPTSGCIV